MASDSVDQDDKISVTSTAPSEQRDEYLVDRIVGEREIDGAKEYLVMWEGYPEERCTWEPETNFDGGVIIPAWEHVVMRVKRGLEKPFDVAALERTIREWEEATALRKYRRREKRKRLGLPVAESEEEGEQVEDEDALSDNANEQDQSLAVGTSDISKSRQGRKKRVSRVIGSSSDKDNTVRLASRSNSISSESASSDDGRTLVQQKDLARAVNKVSYQGTQRPSKAASERPKQAPNFIDQLISASPTAPPDRAIREEKRKVPESNTRIEKAAKSTPGSVKIQHGLVSRRSSIEIPQKQTSSPQPSKPQPTAAQTANAHTAPNAPKKRGRPFGWRKYPVPADQTSKEPQQPRVGVKSAPSSTRRKVTGSVISKNWNKPIVKKRLGFATATSIAVNPDSFSAKNQSRFMNLATQHKFAKASRNEPPPRIEDLVLYNARDGPPKPGVKRLTPFQMIQEGITAGISSSTVSTEEGKKIRRVSFTDKSENPKSINTLSPKAQHLRDLPLTIETRKSVTFTEPKDIVSPSDISIAEIGKAMIVSEPEELNEFIEAGTIPPKSQYSSEFPLTIETQKSVAFTELKNTTGSPITPSVGIRKTVMFAEPEKMDTSPDGPLARRAEESSSLIPTTKWSSSKDSRIASSVTQPQSSASGTERRKSMTPAVGDAMDLSSDYVPPETISADMPSNPISDARMLINSWGFQNPPSRRPDPLTRSGSIDDRSNRFDEGGNSLNDLTETPKSREKALVIAEPEQKATEESSYDMSYGEDVRVSDEAAVLPWNQIRGNTCQTIRKCTVFGSIFRGENIVTHVAFVGLPFHVRTMLLSIKSSPRDLNIHLRHRCTAVDYKMYFHTEEPFYFGAGHVHALEQRQPKVDEVAHDLKLHGYGALFFCERFSLLMYPTETEEWSFLDEHFIREVNLPVSLRFVIFRPLPEFMDYKEGKASAKDDSLELINDEPLINHFFRETYNIDYKTLVPEEKKSFAFDNDIFFLMYPPFKKEEHDLVVLFLETNKATVYSAYTPGSWDYILKEVHDAIILIHSQFPALHTIPSLYRAALASRTLYHPMFHITLDLNFAPPELETPQHLIKLFPSGGALLLTDSFIVTQPRQAVRMLHWFVYHIIQNKRPGSWKLALRPRFRDWLLRMIESLDPPKGNAFVELYTMFYKLLPLALMDEDTDFELPKPEAPVVTPRYLSNFDYSVGLGVLPNETETMRRNDERLVDWFASWARTKVYTLRRLHVVYSDQLLSKEQIKPWRHKWHHLGFWTVEGCFREHSIGKWEEERKPSDMRMWEKKEKINKKVAEWERDRKEKREAASVEVNEVQG